MKTHLAARLLLIPTFLLACTIPAFPATQEKDGVRLDLTIKTLSRDDGPQDFYWKDINRVLAIKVTVKNTGFHPLAGEGNPILDSSLNAAGDHHRPRLSANLVLADHLLEKMVHHDLRLVADGLAVALDVLKHYTPVDSYYRLAKTVEGDPECSRKAARSATIHVSMHVVMKST